MFTTLNYMTINKMNSPFFPLTVFNLDRDSYDCQLWARNNTPKESVFVFLKPIDHGFYNEAGFRRFSGRSMFLGDYANFYFNYDLINIHFQREALVKELGDAILKKQAVKDVLDRFPWRLDYIVLPKGFSLLGYKQVYSNNSYTCFFVGRERMSYEVPYL